MRALSRKLVRDLSQLRGHAIAIVLVAAAGVAIFLAMQVTIDSLLASRDAYYLTHRFGQVFAHVQRAPITLSSELHAIPGARDVDTRLVVDAPVRLPTLIAPGMARFVSIRADQTQNRVHLRAGRLPAVGSDEILLSSSFAARHRLTPGDSIETVLNGKSRRLKIAGIGLSPEFTYAISGSTPWPEDERFAVAWMMYDALATSVGMAGAFNDVSLTLEAGASEAEVVAALDRLLLPYGGFGAIGRDRQLSNWYVSNEIQQLRMVGLVVPAIFMGAAAFLIHVVLSRLVRLQRVQIATLKALGYTNVSIGAHYLAFGVALALGGAALGALVGVALGQSLAKIFAAYLSFPQFELRISAGTVLAMLGVSTLAGISGVLRAVRRAASFVPAEAMRPEAPPSYRPAFVERLGISAWVSNLGRITLRNVSRQPGRALLSVVGMALAVAVLIVGTFIEDSIRYVVEISFRVVQTQDLVVLFDHPRGADAETEIARLPGVIEVEGAHEVPVWLRRQAKAYRTTLTGMVPHPRLQRLVAHDRTVVDPPSHGLVLTTHLARLLGARVGDQVTVEVLSGERPVRDVPVTGMVDESIGSRAYMSLDGLRELTGEGEVVARVHVLADKSHLGSLYRALGAIPALNRLSLTEAGLLAFEATFAKNLRVFRAVETLFAVVLAMAIAYNDASTTFAERSRDIATMRVLGFYRRETSAMLITYLSALTLAALPLGFALGNALARLVIFVATTEVVRLPLVIAPSTYATAALVVVGCAALSAASVVTRIRSLDLERSLRTGAE